MEKCIESSQPHEVGTVIDFSETKAEPQSGQVPCPSSHSWWAAELALNPGIWLQTLCSDQYRVLALFLFLIALSPVPGLWLVSTNAC